MTLDITNNCLQLEYHCMKTLFKLNNSFVKLKCNTKDLSLLRLNRLGSFQSHKNPPTSFEQIHIYIYTYVYVKKLK